MLINTKSKFFRSIALLTSGSMLGQIIGFIGSMFMTRLYLEEEIGIMTTVISVSGIFAPVINGRFDFAIVKEQNKDNVFALVKFTVLFGLVMSLIISIGSLPYFYGIDGFISPLVAVLFVFLILVIHAFSNVFRSYNNNIGDFRTMTTVIVMRRLAEEVSMIIFGLIGGKSLGLLISRVIGQYFGMRREIRNIKLHFAEIIAVDINRMKSVYHLHKRQLFLSTPASLLNAASYSLISLLIGKYYGLGVLGVYAISFAVLGLPLSVISGNVSKVYFGEASKEYAETGSFSIATIKSLKFLVVCSIAFFFAMYFLFPILVPIIYGKAYSASSIMIRILAPMFAVRFVSSSLTTGLVVCNKQNYEFLIQIGFIVSIFLVSTLSSYLNWSISIFLLGISITYTIVYLFNLFVIYYYSKKH